jgi:hypothetical protein
MCCCKVVISGMWLLTTIPISHDTLQDEYPDGCTKRQDPVAPGPLPGHQAERGCTMGTMLAEIDRTMRPAHTRRAGSACCRMLTADGRPLIERVADLLPKPEEQKVVALPARWLHKEASDVPRARARPCRAARG